jgi:hypothetical protein
MTSTDSGDDSINQMQRLITLRNLLYLIPNDTDHTNDGPKMTFIIHHQFPGVELISPVYFSLFATCCLSPDQRVDFSSTTQADFNIHPNRNVSIGALMYKLQRKNIDQSNGETISSKEEATCIQFIIIWKVKNHSEFHAYPFLIEHDEGHVWDSAKLMELAFVCGLLNIQYIPTEETWLMHDNAVLMTSLNITHEEECYKLEMTISEGSIKDDTQRLWRVDLDR